MKKIILTALAILSSVMCIFGANENDTTIIYNGMNIRLSANDQSSVKVDITKSNSTVYSAVFEEKSDTSSVKTTYRVVEDIPLLNLLNRNNTNTKWNSSKFNPHICCLSVGFNKPMNTENNVPDNNIARSTNITFIPFEHGFAFGRNFGIGIGWGFEWENYRLTDDEFFTYKNGVVGVDNVKTACDNPKATVDNSKLRTFGFVFPVMLELHQDKINPLFCSVGTVLNIVPTSRLYTKISNDKDIEKLSYRGLHHNVFGCDLMAQVGYGNLGLFARYSMTELFKTDHGPKMNALTFGISWYL